MPSLVTCVLSVLILACASASAHPLNWTRLTMSAAGGDGRLEARLEIDLAPYVGGYEAYLKAAASDDGGATLIEAAKRAWRELSLTQGDQRVIWTLEELIPPPPDDGEFFSPLPAPMTFVRWSGQPSSAGPVVIEVAAGTDMELPLVLRFLDRPDALPILLSADQSSSRYAAPHLPVKKKAIAAAADEAIPHASFTSVLIAYAKQGFLHILPHGIDHILFILGLFLAGDSWRRLLLYVTAFTVAHTLTLALVTLNLLAAPPRVVEPLIALSIVWLAWENLNGGRRGPLRLLVVFLFGLLHGMGFASVLGLLGLADEYRVISLFAFNAGVELGQLAVLALAACLFGWWRQSKSFRDWVVIPASLVIGMTGAWWAVERLVSI